MDIQNDDQNVHTVTTGTAITACSKSLEQKNMIVNDDKYVVIDPDSSESSSSDESEIELVNQYNIADVRPVIGEYSKCYILKYINYHSTCRFLFNLVY